MPRLSSATVHVCRFAGCFKTFKRLEGLEAHEHEHHLHRKQIAHDRILEDWGLPSSVCLLCKEFAKGTATSYLHVRILDVEHLLPQFHSGYMRKIQALLPILDAHSSDDERSISKLAAHWSYEQCFSVKCTIHRLMNKLVTEANGRGHPDNKIMRSAITQEVDYLLFEVLGSWRRRGLS